MTRKFLFTLLIIYCAYFLIGCSQETAIDQQILPPLSTTEPEPFSLPIVDRTIEGIELVETRTEKINRQSFKLDYYQNNAYICGLSGNYSFLVVNPNGNAEAEAPLWVYLHGGGVGYWDAEGEYQSTKGQTGDTWNHQEDSAKLEWHLSIRIQDGKGGFEDQTLLRRIEEGYRLLVVSYCDHDFYSGLGTAYPNHPTNPDAQVNGLQATMAAIDYTAENYPTTHVWAHGTSAGSVGVWALASSYAAEGNPLSGIVADSGIITPLQYDFQSLTEQGEGRFEETWEPEGVTEKVGFYVDVNIPAWPEGQIANQDFRAVPALFIAGDADPFCFGHVESIPEAIEAGLSNCGYITSALNRAISEQKDSPHEFHLLPDTGHVPTNDPGPANDIVDSFIEKVLATNPPHFSMTILETESDNAEILNEIESDDINVLYLGHSFGRPFAEQLEKFSLLAGIENHVQHKVTQGGENGTPQLLWESAKNRSRIQAELDTGEMDVVIMICCSPEFRESYGASDQAIWDITEYALAQNPNTKIGLALPWQDFPQDFENALAHRSATDSIYPLWQDLASNLSEDFSGIDVFTIYHGAAVYELREMYENDLLRDVAQMTGPKASSLFTDQKGHPGQIVIDTGTLLWLAAIHDVDITTFPLFEEYETDIRIVAQRILEEQNSK